jgi:methylmalonyl-CoA mutase N-terminal domain/subunit
MDNLYTPESISDLDYRRDLGDAGQAPYTRGIYKDMYSKKEFTMRQLTGFGSPEDTNKRMKFMLANGATGLSILFDFPTIQMYDSDDPISCGQVGLSGVCVDSIEDMAILFDGIDLEKISISIVTHYPTNTAILFSMFLAMAQERGVDFKNLRGSVQNDITMEEVVRCGSEFISPKDCFKIQCDNMEYITNNLPKWNPITLNGYNLREAGTDAITEMAVAMANGLCTIEEMTKRGYQATTIAKRIAFFWSIGNNFFDEVARLRAARRIWSRLLRDRFFIDDESSLLLRCHVQTSGISLTRQEPMNNIVRSSFQALAAVLGGVQSLHVDSFDEAYSVPSEEAALISLRTQQILQQETGVTSIVDPLGGSYYVEFMTNKIERKIINEIERIEANGGYLKMIESGELYRSISDFGYQQQRDIEDGKTIVVGVNKYRGDNPEQSFLSFEYPEGVEDLQTERLLLLKARRSENLVSFSLHQLQEACKSGKNIVPFCIDCAKDRCTEGEIFKAVKSSFGDWNKMGLEE